MDHLSEEIPTNYEISYYYTNDTGTQFFAYTLTYRDLRIFGTRLRNGSFEPLHIYVYKNEGRVRHKLEFNKNRDGSGTYRTTYHYENIDNANHENFENQSSLGSEGNSNINYNENQHGGSLEELNRADRRYLQIRNEINSRRRARARRERGFTNNYNSNNSNNSNNSRINERLQEELEEARSNYQQLRERYRHLLPRVEPVPPLTQEEINAPRRIAAAAATATATAAANNNADVNSNYNSMISRLNDFDVDLGPTLTADIPGVIVDRFPELRDLLIDIDLPNNNHHNNHESVSSVGSEGNHNIITGGYRLRRKRTSRRRRSHRRTRRQNLQADSLYGPYLRTRRRRSHRRKNNM